MKKNKKKAKKCEKEFIKEDTKNKKPSMSQLVEKLKKIPIKK